MKGKNGGSAPYRNWGKMSHSQKCGNHRGGGQGNKVAPDGSTKKVVKNY